MTLPVSQLFHFSTFQLGGISTVLISKREREEGGKKIDKPDGEELNQVQVVTINSIPPPPFKYHNNSKFISPKIKQSVDIKAE